jgi:tetratricopeptide (TPR) repeat protein
MAARLLFTLMIALTAMALAPSDVEAQIADDTSRREALQHYRAGQEFLSSEQFEKAADAFQKSIAKDSLMALAHYGLGQSYMALRRYASAVVAFQGCREAYRRIHSLEQTHRIDTERMRREEILALNDSLRQISSGRVAVNPVVRNRMESTLRDLERDQNRNTPGGEFKAPAQVSLALGSAYFRNNDTMNAEREWKAAVDANPKLGEAHNNLAALYAVSGRKQEAEAAVRAAEQAGFRVHPQLKEDIRRMS